MTTIAVPQKKRNAARRYLIGLLLKGWCLDETGGQGKNGNPKGCHGEPRYADALGKNVITFHSLPPVTFSVMTSIIKE